ncbi:ribosomal protein L9 [Reticulomyxa filosa]|uniref:Ribosomal protein L9 n=1 Tax=Reticulomyxa filosa TaxID=46433 RepID=X6M750_RETFI|nr:ribosomal protein L9 [Reticulomyxa filosa]|eukprot:ETO09754.1 ribosomal protein L9 [Reticulomyxa filosa]
MLSAHLKAIRSKPTYDDAFTLITKRHVTESRTYKHYQWRPLVVNKLRPLLEDRNRRRKNFKEAFKLPEHYEDKYSATRSRKKLKVIFLHNMDSFIAGEVVTVPEGLYRHWLWPEKIALPATSVNVARFGHLNANLREERERAQKMVEMSQDLAKFRLEFKVRLDEKDDCYTHITKQRIWRELLLKKKISLEDPIKQIQIFKHIKGK